MKYTIRYTQTAKQDLTEIALGVYQVSQDAATAIRFVQELREYASRLEMFPLSANLLDDENLIHLQLRYVIAHDYLLFYKYSEADNTVYIESILNGKIDYVRVLKERLSRQK